MSASAALAVAAPASFLLLAAALPWSIAPISIAVVLCGVLTLAAWWSPGGIGWNRTPLDLPAIGWIAALVIAALFALDPWGSLPRVKKGLLLAVVPVAAWHARDPKLVRRAVAVLLVSAALATIYALARFAHDGGAFPARVRGLAGHALTYGGQATLLAALAMSILAKGPGRRWTLGVSAFLLLLLPALAGSYTRSAWIATFVAAAVILARTRARFLPLLLGLPVLAIAVAPQGYRDRALSVFDSRSVWNRERIILWKAGIRIFAEHPTTGVGLQDLRPILDRTKEPGAHEHHGHMHNVPLQVAVSMGVVGLAALAWLVVRLYRTAGRRWRAPLPRGDLGSALRLASVASLTAFFVAGLFEWNLGDEELLVFLCVLVGAGYGATRSEKG